MTLPRVVPAGVPFAGEVHLREAAGHGVMYRVDYALEILGKEKILEGGVGSVEVAMRDLYHTGVVSIPNLRISEAGEHRISVKVGALPRTYTTVRVIPGWWTLIPPLLATLLALWFRGVLVPLGVGGFVGVWMLTQGNLAEASFAYVETFALGAFSHRAQASGLLAIIVLGSVLGLVTRSGGTAALGTWLGRKGSGKAGRGMLATWLMGLVIFVDDYASALFAGTSMRSLTDRFRVSREKLAFIVDATAGPVSSLVVVSSWLAVQIQGIGTEYEKLELGHDPLSVLFESTPYRFYPVFLMMFVALLLFLRRDFGPMWRAERRAQHDAGLVGADAMTSTDFIDANAERKATPADWVQVVVPVVVLVVATGLGLYFDGKQRFTDEREVAIELRDLAEAHVELAQQAGDAAGVAHAMGRARDAQSRLYLLQPGRHTVFRFAESAIVVLWAALLSLLSAFLLSLWRKRLTLYDARSAMLHGVRSVVPVAGVLVLVWVLSEVCRVLQTAAYLIEWVGTEVSLTWLPASVFLISSLVAMITGSSWRSMVALFPVIVPMAYATGEAAGFLGTQQQGLLAHCIGSLVSGVVVGDHCSPISDTTVLSSIASSCDHRDHVRTQWPYAMVVAGVAFVVGELGTGFGLYPWWGAWMLGGIALALIVFLFGKGYGPAANGDWPARHMTTQSFGASPASSSSPRPRSARPQRSSQPTRRALTPSDTCSSSASSSAPSPVSSQGPSATPQVDTSQVDTPRSPEPPPSGRNTLRLK